MDFLEEVDASERDYSEKYISRCRDYPVCREEHCRGYGTVSCKAILGRGIHIKRIPCRSFIPLTD